MSSARVEFAVGAGVAHVPRPLLRPDLDDERMLVGARELPQHLVEVEVAVDEQRAVDAEEDDGGDDGGEHEVAATDAALVVGAVAPVAMQQASPRRMMPHMTTNSTDTISVVMLNRASLRKPSNEASSGRSGRSPSVIDGRLYRGFGARDATMGSCASVLALLALSTLGSDVRRLAREHRGDAAFRSAIGAQLGHDERARRVLYREVLALGLDWSPVWNNLAVIAVHRHEYSAARKLLAHAVAANDRDVVALTNYGVMSYHLSDYAEARRTLEAARRLRAQHHRQHPVDGAHVVGRGFSTRARRRRSTTRPKRYLARIDSATISTRRCRRPT